MTIEERKKIIENVKENIKKFMEEIEYKTKHNRPISYTEKILMTNYTRLLIEIDRWEKNV